MIDQLLMLRFVKKEALKQDESSDLKWVMIAKRNLPEDIDSTSTMYFAAGLQYYENKEYKQAFESFDSVTKLHPILAIAHNRKGNSNVGLKKLTEALENYSRALELEPFTIDYHYDRNNVLIGLKRYDEAIECYNITIEKFPDAGRAYFYLGRIFRFKYDNENAKLNFEKAVELGYDRAKRDLEILENKS